MRKLVFNVIAILCAVVISTSLSGMSTYTKDFKKVIREEFTISKDGEVNIANTYGTVKINTTGGDEVVIEVTIKVDKRSEDDAEEFFEKVNIEFDNSRSEVSAMTKIGNQKKSSWTKWLNPGNWNNNSSYSVNYEVWMPSTCSLDLTNKYGDIAVSDIDNNVKLTLRYGDGVLENIAGDLELDLAYGDLRIGNVNDLEMDIAYGEFKCKSSRDVSCDSKYSDIYIDKARRLEADTGYDDYFIGVIETSFVNDGHYDDFEIDYVDEFEIDAGYSDFVIDELGSGGVFDAGYGDLVVKKVQSLAKGLEVDGRYSDVSLRMSIPFSIELESKYTDVDMPSKMNYSYKDKEGSKEDFKGTYGNSSGNKIIASIGGYGW